MTARFSIRRREFLALLGAGVIVWPVVARAQQRKMPVIGFLNGASREGYARILSAFHQGLAETGYVEGQNLAIEYRWADGQYDRLPAMVADLVQRKVAVIVATGTPANLAAKTMTVAIPVVFTTSSDPVKLGLVSSLNRPGGNVTGAVQMNVEVMPKLLELVHECIPGATSMALLVNPSNPNRAETLWRDAQVAASALGLQLVLLKASNERDFETTFATFVQSGAGGLVIGADSFFNSRSKQLAAAALHHAVPAILNNDNREFTENGGLMSYGGSLMASYRWAGIYTGRILKGEKPSDLAVVQSTKFEFIINIKTAKALGLTIPLSLLSRADEVIE
jgi:putative tryptophan/tyrosine transport system substrate-binding protein